MNKKDLLLIGLILVISLSLYFIFKSIDAGDYAYVYYENKIIKKINLSIDDIYTVEGYNGDVVIEVNSNKIRVIEEDSPYHLCSKQGYVSSPLQPIICLPNKIVIKIIDERESVDTVVR